VIVKLEIDTDNTGPEEEAILAVLRRTEIPDDPATLEQLKAHRVRLEALFDEIEGIAEDALTGKAPLEPITGLTHRRALGAIYELIRDAKKGPADADPTT